MITPLSYTRIQFNRVSCITIIIDTSGYYIISFICRRPRSRSRKRFFGLTVGFFNIFFFFSFYIRLICFAIYGRIKHIHGRSVACTRIIEKKREYIINRFNLKLVMRVYVSEIYYTFGVRLNEQ